jgi:hypothetical protein
MEIVTSFSKLAQGIEDVKTWALLHYVFYAHRCGLKIKVENGRVDVIPFVNVNYDNRNAWGDAKSQPKLKFAHGSIENHYSLKARCYQENETFNKGFLKDTNSWWLNGHTLCNVVPQNLWSLRGIEELQQMIQAANVFNGVYVINKRDSPISRSFELDHPFPAMGKLWCHPMHVRPRKIPMSFYVGPMWSDAAIPPPEAWQWATKNDENGPGFLLHECFRKKGVLTREEYELKVKKTIFRGSATGAGLNFQNQRLHLCNLGDLNGLLDAGITAWNSRDRVIQGVVDFQVPPPYPLKPKVSPKDQSLFASILCVDGHQAANRLIWNLASGSAIIMIESNKFTLAPKMWIHKYLMENVHYVSVKSDLSDLQHVLENIHFGDFAFNLAKNAYRLAYTHLNTDALAKETRDAFIFCDRS